MVPGCSTKGDFMADVHIECVSDFCGNARNPGAWADLWRRDDGSRYVALGGDWQSYAPHAPDVIDETDSRFAGFLAACDSGDDFGFVAKNWV